MNRTKFLKGECQHCGGHLEFPAEMAGLPADCPHCGQQTDLLLAPPPQEPTVPRRTIIWAVIGMVILGLGLVGALAALKRAERWATRQKQRSQATLPVGQDSQTPAEPIPPAENAQNQNGFVVSPVTLERAPGSSLVYAVGTLKNTSDHKRFGVKVELDLLDANEQKVGTATDYQPAMETNAAWHFKALVVDSNAAAAKLAAIKEDQ